MYATYNGTTTAQQQGLGLKDRHGARDAADVSRVLGTFFSFLVFWTILILLQCILLTTATTMVTTTWTREMSAGGLRCCRRVLTPRCVFLFYFLGWAQRVEYLHIYLYIYTNSSISQPVMCKKTRPHGYGLDGYGYRYRYRKGYLYPYPWYLYPSTRRVYHTMLRN